MSTSAPHITLVGCGKMGGAMLQSWLERDIPAQTIILDPSENLNVPNGATHIQTPDGRIKDSDIIILAIKPQMMESVCPVLAPLVSPNALILSIAAGQRLETLGKYFAPNQPIIRAMPNTPASIGKGISAAITGTHASQTHKEQTNALLNACGKTIWVESEDQLDAVTALSGSGPAYVFLLIEILTKAGEALNLPAEIATTLARETVIGSAALAETQSDTAAATLRENVTSPGGTTQAALDVLMDGELEQIFKDALKNAAARSRELSS